MAIDIAANPNPSPRSGTILVANHTVTVDQDPAACTFTLSDSALSVGAGKADRSVNVTASSPSCAWTASSDMSWMTIKSAASDTGNGGRPVERPFLILAQHTLFDPSRAPEGKHTAWAYCHVPNGWGGDITDAVEAQVERFAPGFRDLVLARPVTTPADFEARNRNFVGGDISGGAMALGQLLASPARA